MLNGSWWIVVVLLNTASLRFYSDTSFMFNSTTNEIPFCLIQFIHILSSYASQSLQLNAYSTYRPMIYKESQNKIPWENMHIQWL